MKFSLVGTLLLALGATLISATEYFTVTDKVYLDIKVGNDEARRVVVGLFGQDVPRTVDNFKTLASTGVSGKTYAGSPFHRVIKNFMIQGGDVISGDGTGSISKFGKQFNDENFKIKHAGPGLLSMANSGRNTNGCQFFITLVPTPWLDNKHVVFGKVVEGFDLIKEIAFVAVDQDDRPLRPVTIVKSGILPADAPYEESDDSTLTFWQWLKYASLPVCSSMGIVGLLHYFYRQLKIIDQF